MDPALLTALLTFLTALVPILGTLIALAINHSRLSAKDKDLALALNASVTGAVKATAQTMTAHARDEKGSLGAIVAEAAKKEALESAKILLGSQQMEAAKAKYGLNGELDKVLSTLLEAALHDVKNTKISTSTTTSAASVTPSGIVETTQTKTTSATEPIHQEK